MSNNEGQVQIKDVLHLYWNVPLMAVSNFHPEGDGEWEQCWLRKIPISGTEYELAHENGSSFFAFEDRIKLLLRPLSDIKEEDIIGWARFCGRESEITPIAITIAVKAVKKKGIEAFQVSEGDFHLVPLLVLYLLKQGFDLFNLIPRGLAIDSTNQ